MDPIYVLLPGMIGTDHLFLPLLAAIPSEIRRKIITYPTDLFLQYGDVLKLIEAQLPDNEPLVVIGESYSGALALALAAAHPQRVRAVVLSGGYVLPPWPSWLRFLIRPVLLQIRIPSFLIRFFAAGADASEKFVTEVRNALGVPLPEVMAARAREALRMDNTAYLKQCHLPILYLAPAEDRLVPPRNLRRILQIRPDVQVHKMTGPHLILQRSPLQAWQAIHKFVSNSLQL